MEETYEIVLPDIAQEIIRYLSGCSLPDSDAVSRWALEKERKIFFEKDVDCSLMEIQRLILRWNMEDAGKPPEERKPIWLYVMSYGGDIDYMWSFIGIIKASVTPVYTVNVGVAASASALIFLSGHKRYMLPMSRMIIHEGSAQLAGDAIKVMDQTASYKKQLAQMKAFILENTNIPRAQLMKKRNNDWELDAEYCLEKGACDKIIESLDDII